MLRVAWLWTEMEGRGWRMEVGQLDPRAPGGDDAGTEGQEMGMLHMEVHSYLRQRPARPFVHFLFSKIYK